MGIDEARQQRHVAEIDVDGLAGLPRATATIEPFSTRITWSRSTRPVSTSSSRAAVTVSAGAGKGRLEQSPAHTPIKEKDHSHRYFPLPAYVQNREFSLTRSHTWSGV